MKGFEMAKKASLKIVISITAAFLVVTFLAIFIPAMVNNHINKSLDPQQDQKSEIQLLKVKNKEEQYYLSHLKDCVTKINSLSDFEQYITKFESFEISDYENTINESAFETKCIFGIVFYCCSTELNMEGNKDGRGPEIDQIQIENNTLFINLSVPTIGFDEMICSVAFLAISSKDMVDDDFHYSYDITQRDTGNKGSSYYLKNDKKG